MRFHIIRNARIVNVGKSQSCMVSKSRIIWKQTTVRGVSRRAEKAWRYAQQQPTTAVALLDWAWDSSHAMAPAPYRPIPSRPALSTVPNPMFCKHARLIFTYRMSARMSDYLYTHP